MIDRTIPIIDSNVLISYFSEDINFKQTEKMLENDFYLNDYILCEVLNFLQNKLSYSASFKAERFIFDTSFGFLPVSTEVIDIARDIRETYADNKFTFTDCIILAQSQIYEMDIYTNDEKMGSYTKAKVFLI